MKERMVSSSVKFTKDEKEIITNAAKERGETFSYYVRRTAVESSTWPIAARKDVMGLLYGIGIDMSCMTQDNLNEQIQKINQKGIAICQILSGK